MPRHVMTSRSSHRFHLESTHTHTCSNVHSYQLINVYLYLISNGRELFNFTIGSITALNGLSSLIWEKLSNSFRNRRPSFYGHSMNMGNIPMEGERKSYEWIVCKEEERTRKNSSVKEWKNIERRKTNEPTHTICITWSIVVKSPKHKRKMV